MAEPEPLDVKVVIAEILAAGKTFYYIAKLMRRQIVQIQRMAKNGRCQPYEYLMLMMIYKDVISSANDTISQAEKVEMPRA